MNRVTLVSTKKVLGYMYNKRAIKEQRIETLKKEIAQLDIQIAQLQRELNAT